MRFPSIQLGSNKEKIEQLQTEKKHKTLFLLHVQLPWLSDFETRLAQHERWALFLLKALLWPFWRKTNKKKIGACNDNVWEEKEGT